MSDARIFKTKPFHRFTRREGVGDAALIDAVKRAEKGSVDADLGGGVIKQRIARPGAGKSGGYRAIVMFRKGALAVFMFGFAKSGQENISAAEERAFKEAAKHVLSLTAAQIDALIRNGDFIEVKRT